MYLLEFEDIEFSALGQKLPIGIWTPEGERLQDFVINRYVNRYDLILGDLEDANKEHPQKINRIQSQFLPQVIAEIGGYSFSQIAEMFPRCSSSKLIGEMYLADVMALALNTRSVAHESAIFLNATCPCPEAIKIMGGKNTAPHDLNTIVMRTLKGDRPPRLTIPLSRSIEYEGRVIAEIEVEPIRFKNLPQLQETPLPLDIRLAQQWVSSIPFLEIYHLLTLEDLEKIHEYGSLLHFGADTFLEMDCPDCKLTWNAPLMHGLNYESFYFSLLSAPRENEHDLGSTSNYFNRYSKLLCFGEQAPCSDLQAVLNLTPREMAWWAKDISDTYEKQQKEMDKAKSQSRKR